MPVTKFPFPYKLGVFKKDPSKDDWAKSSITIFDCAEDPLPPDVYGTNHDHLRKFCTEALKRIEAVLHSLNYDPIIESLRYTWIIKSVHIDIKTESRKQEFMVVFVLRDNMQAFESHFREQGESRDEWRGKMSPAGSWARTPSPESEKKARWDDRRVDNW
ncbi:hypothetical protein H072_4788 [Dactylellina haptotyla CBS 200.50]|uniref:Uncharacterized protein n=1 Tax=Dactylellina haptotyla (strain CBS 200.50) TaxID=1284197 RepID=S8AE06_DACHA|nr:hypothetical protein H072_4788 [Dactylellina haptotyla CBS 200.50]